MVSKGPTEFSYPQPFWREIVPRIIEVFLLRTVKLETGGSEAIIPATGTFVATFAPHCGWIDSIVIDACFSRAGRAWPVWLTKEENRSLPSIITGGRAICIDRQYPEPSAVRAVRHLLAQPNAALATGIEGTRFGNPKASDDARTLGEFKTGSLRFAIAAQVPILPVVVLGGEQIAPRLDETWQDRGSRAALHQIWPCIVHPQPMQVRFLPLYRDHLHEGGAVRGKQLGEQAALHTAKLRELLVAEILRLDPNYPLGS